MTNSELTSFLDNKVEQYNQPGFIENDPISIPHQFSKQQDIEIMGLFASVLAWGQRITIINNCKRLINWMDGAPHQFITQHQEGDLKAFVNFKHRTFNGTDLLYFIAFLQDWYGKNESLESAFIPPNLSGLGAKEYLTTFRNNFFALDFFPDRTKKHISSPESGSSCKRLNMYLRWMVRQDDQGVDFGIWKTLSPAQLICPLDVHVERVSRKLGLLQRTIVDWKAAEELTAQLRLLDPNDPVKYDFALFGLGVEEKF